MEGEALDRYIDGLSAYDGLIYNIQLEPAPQPVPVLSKDEITRLQRGFGYTREDIKMVVAPMALESKEATWSMGDDTPIAPLARTPRPLYGFFRQRFAQVTNPAIDSLRESCVVSLRTRLGPWPHLLDKHAPLPGLVLPSPFLSLGQMEALREGTYPLRDELPLARMYCTFAPVRTLESAVGALGDTAVKLVRDGARILLLTDRAASAQSLPIPMAMATGAVHHALVKAGLRTKVGLALDAGDCRDLHHAAVLIGYGAGAVCPWLALQTARSLAGEDGEAGLLKALQSGLAKVMSKMGISVLDSYRAAQLFDILGLDPDIVDRCFPGTPSPLGGRGFAEIEASIRASWAGELNNSELPDYGWVRFRRDEGAELHMPGSRNGRASFKWLSAPRRRQPKPRQQRLPMPKHGLTSRAQEANASRQCCETCWTSVPLVRRYRYIKSSRSPVWRGVSSPAPCRSAQSAPRRMKPSPSP